MLDDIEKILYDEQTIKEIVAGLGRRISEDYRGKNLLLVSVLKGSVVFMADLMRSITIPCSIDFMAVSSYGDRARSSGNIQIRKDLDIDLQGYDLLIVEDIFDSGRTLQHLSHVLMLRNPKSMRLCTLLDKPECRDKSVTIKADYVGCEVPAAFVVGYGLDYGEKYRNLPYIGILKRHVYDKIEGSRTLTAPEFNQNL